MVIKNTIQGVMIKKYLMGVNTHPTAEQIYENVKKNISTITLATVYRNLNYFAERGEILRLEINKEYRFDADIKPHQHCVCDHCGKIKDYFKKEISEYALDKIKKEDFEPRHVSVIFFGLCNKCKETKK